MSLSQTKKQKLLASSTIVTVVESMCHFSPRRLGLCSLTAVIHMIQSHRRVSVLQRHLLLPRLNSADLKEIFGGERRAKTIHLTQATRKTRGSRIANTAEAAEATILANTCTQGMGANTISRIRNVEAQTPGKSDREMAREARRKKKGAKKIIRDREARRKEMEAKAAVQVSEMGMGIHFTSANYPPKKRDEGQEETDIQFKYDHDRNICKQQYKEPGGKHNIQNSQCGGSNSREKRQGNGQGGSQKEKGSKENNQGPGGGQKGNEGKNSGPGLGNGGNPFHISQYPPKKRDEGQEEIEINHPYPGSGTLGDIRATVGNCKPGTACETGPRCKGEKCNGITSKVGPNKPGKGPPNKRLNVQNDHSPGSKSGKNCKAGKNNVRSKISVSCDEDHDTNISEKEKRGKDTPVQSTYHYDHGPNAGQTCQHTAQLTGRDKIVQNSQCGSANRISAKLPGKDKGVSGEGEKGKASNKQSGSTSGVKEQPPK